MKLIAKILMAVIVASSLMQGNLGDIKTLLLIAGIIQIVPMLASLLNKDSGGWAFVAVLAAILLIRFGGGFVLLIGVILGYVAFSRAWLRN